MLQLCLKVLKLARYYSSRIRDQRSRAPTVRTDKNKTHLNVSNLAQMWRNNK